MALAVWNRTIVDEDGTYIPGAGIEVRVAAGGALATIYSDSAGTSAISNPLTASATGFAQFYALSNTYSIEVNNGTSTITWIEDMIAEAETATLAQPFTETDAAMASVTVPAGIDVLTRMPSTASAGQVAPIDQYTFWRKIAGATSTDPYFVTAGPVTWVRTGVREDEILSTFTSGISGVFNNPEIAGLKPFVNYAAFLAASISSVVDRVMWYDGTDIITVTRDPAQSGGTVAQTDGTLWYPETIDAADGSAAAPSITFYSDNNTGLYNAAADQIGFATAGTLRALLSSAAFNIDVPITGTAVQSSATDTTAGALLTVGAFGLGEDAGPVIDALDTAYTSGLYYANGGANPSAPTGDNPFPSLNGAFGLLIGNSSVGISSEFVYQTAFRFGLTHEMAIRQKSTTAVGWSSWSRVYHQSDILNTVSQTAGVPTGGLIERDSNASGEYVKFADGTMICTITQDMGSAIANGSGDRTSPYYTDNVNLTFPAVFIASPSVAFEYVASAGGIVDRAYNGASVAISTTQVAAFRAIAATDSATARDVNVYVTAVGRWF